jgi:uncharacterized protein YdhG (YjbR/CyaY superfamily)
VTRPPKTVDEYLAALSDDASRAALEKLREAIKAAAPEAQEVISYRIPLYRYHGHLVGFAAFKNHCAFFVTSSSVMEGFKEELAAYDTAQTKTTIRFSAKKPLPAALVKKIVRHRMRENKERARKP